MSPPIKSLLNDQFVDMAFIVAHTGMTDKWFYKLIALGRFPPAIKFGRRSRWLKSEVLAWEVERIRESRPDYIPPDYQELPAVGL
ncbi:putative transcriptional regulator [Enterobacterales bacterium 8AC]|nr:putative transcriptional regulator [Enterobacterales bacterium 8AC]